MHGFVVVFDNQVSPILTLIGTTDNVIELTFSDHRRLVSQRNQSSWISLLCGSLSELKVFPKSTLLVRWVNPIRAS